MVWRCPAGTQGCDGEQTEQQLDPEFRHGSEYLSIQVIPGTKISSVRKRADIPPQIMTL